jgi:uncharacterized membrane protein
MKRALIAAAFGSAALLATSAGSSQATDIDVYRADHERSNCRVVETRTTNRWGDEVTIRQRVCS